MAGPGDSAGRGQGRKAPGPAVRGQQRAALGLQEKLRGVGSRLPLGWGAYWLLCKPPVGSSREKESWEEREGRETLGIAGVWASGFKTFRHTTGTRATHSEEASLSVQDSCSWDQQSFFFPSLR